MSDQVAFIGDVHGDVFALERMWRYLDKVDISRRVLLGDYINKGRHSRDVLDFLVDLKGSPDVFLLRGNHEESLISAIAHQDLSKFLALGGAATVRSYVGGDVRKDVFRHFTEELPQDHVDLLLSLDCRYEQADLIAQHRPLVGDGEKFVVYAHIVQQEVPVVTSAYAAIDTGCGSKGGRLTAFLWPEREFIQVPSPV